MNDGFVARNEGDGSGLAWAGYVGGAGNELLCCVSVGPDGYSYVTGFAGTTSTEASFPDGDGLGTIDGPDVTHNGGNGDAFVAEISEVTECPGYEGVPGNHIVGTEGPDVLEGTGAADVICGLGGNDVLWGYGGADVLDGGDGNDSLRGRAGADTLYGAAGNDELLGGARNDVLHGQGDDDKLVGHGGADELYGNAGVDSLNAKDNVSGNDTLNGGPDGPDTCKADPGDSMTGCP
jgi:Ca2+-binding RTX toxin-like protein